MNFQPDIRVVPPTPTLLDVEQEEQLLRLPVFSVSELTGIDALATGKAGQPPDRVICASESGSRTAGRSLSTSRGHRQSYERTLGRDFESLAMEYRQSQTQSAPTSTRETYTPISVLTPDSWTSPIQTTPSKSISEVSEEHEEDDERFHARLAAAEKMIATAFTAGVAFERVKCFEMLQREVRLALLETILSNESLSYVKQQHAKEVAWLRQSLLESERKVNDASQKFENMGEACRQLSAQLEGYCNHAAALESERYQLYSTLASVEAREQALLHEQQKLAQQFEEVQGLYTIELHKQETTKRMDGPPPIEQVKTSSTTGEDA
ncbi:hypothetical protein ANO11243_074110 [Dothideomycetidae sp. 11243]|nr:hypothetical protein ANO11243_074110 [fungal sp. No.11243]